MILEIIGWFIFLLFGIGCIYFAKSFKENDDEDLLFLSWIFGLITLAILIGIMAGSFYDDTAKKEFSIVSLRAEGKVSGSFFLGTGTIKEDTYYFVYKETSRGLTLEEIRVKTDRGSKVYIVEDDDISPRYVDETVCNEKPNLLNWFQDCKHTRKLIVPEGTVVREFRL